MVYLCPSLLSISMMLRRPWSSLLLLMMLNLSENLRVHTPLLLDVLGDWCPSDIPNFSNRSLNFGSVSIYVSCRNTKSALCFLARLLMYASLSLTPY